MEPTLANAINVVFAIAFIAALLGLFVTFLSPRQELRERAPESAPSVVSAD